MPQLLTAHPIRHAPLHRLVFTAARSASADAPAITAVRHALTATAHTAAAGNPHARVEGRGHLVRTSWR